jgi:glycosyltransferase involved in cell wall biosynthesis
MVQLLGDDYNIKIITNDRDFGDQTQYEGIKENKWNQLEKCQVYYAAKNQCIRKLINVTEFDTYYLNSFFYFHLSIKIISLKFFGLIKKKELILAPRGDFMDGALKTRTLKKIVFIVISKLLLLHKNVVWHTSTESEAAEIKREMGMDISYRTALDVPDFSLLERKVNSRKKEKGFLKILFISVIVPKKNLKFAIEVLNKIEGDYTFDIYGPIKDEKYWKECLDAISLKIKARVNYKGEINNSEIHNVYPNYDLFLFPTLGENFGHVVWESLAFGCPVLTTNTTPWNGLKSFNAGWNIDLNSFDKIKVQIEELIEADRNSYSKFTDGTTKYINSFNEEKTLKDNIDLFE